MARTWVLLRGLVREQRHWEGFAQQLQLAAPDDQVICLDVPGNGRHYQRPSPTSVAAMVADIRQQLRQQGATGPFYLVALSLGGMLAVQWLSQAPDEVRYAALINTSTRRHSRFWHRLLPGNYIALLRHGLFARSALGKERFILGLTSNLRPAAFLEAVAQRWASYAREQPVSRGNSLRQLYAAMRFQAPASLPRKVSVTIINGAGDRMVSPRCSASLARAWQCPLLVHPEAGHDLPLDAPDWLIETLLSQAPD